MFYLNLYQALVNSMQSLYYFLFKILLVLPILGIVNSTYMNKFFKVQKIINNIIYILLMVICGYVLIMFAAYGKYDLKLFAIARDIPIVFSANSINLMFGMFMSIVVLFLNLVFQNSFNYLNLPDKYVLYNRQISYLYFFYILLSFSSSIVVSIFIYLLILIYSFFLITNPDLKEFRKNYNIVFCISFICSMVFILIAAFYFFYNENSLFVFQDINGFDTVSGYWVLFVLFLLLLVNISGPFYLIFKEKFYYEDFLPLFTIFFFPFMFFNTFLFIKIIYYVFYNSFDAIKIYFHYSEFFMILLFLTACFFAGKFIKNSIKFILLFSVMNFIVFVSQILFVTTNIEVVKVFSSFLLFMLSILLIVLSYAGVLFLLLKLDITDMTILYKNSKTELNFYIFCLFMPILMNLLSFFDLNLYNFDILYLINLVEILILFIFYMVYIFLSLNKKLKDDAKKPNDVLPIDRIMFFVPQIILLFIFLFFILLKSQIVKYIVFYK